MFTAVISSVYAPEISIIAKVTSLVALMGVSLRAALMGRRIASLYSIGIIRRFLRALYAVRLK